MRRDDATFGQVLHRIADACEQSDADAGEQRGPEHGRIGRPDGQGQPDGVGLELQKRRVAREPAVQAFSS